MNKALPLLVRFACLCCSAPAGATGLTRAAHSGNLARVEALVDRGARVNVRDVDGGTAIHSPGGRHPRK